ncbi:DNA mismatch repair protein MutS [Geodia barretti]|uniref:DNA mismatch repair protein MutS n=1 Tax=Geodia barretti TaxID=519541 RepID=A0AA35XFN4_GEOBA|nr:DNA mismatch repair protein MutS [Geodia barretti]
MGARLLRRWLGQPLLDLEPLERRLAAVQFFHDDAFLRTEATSALSRVADLERILSRIQAQTATPRELVALLGSLRAAADLLNGLSGDGACDLTWLANSLKPIPEVAALVENAIAPEPAGQPGDGGVIREGFSVDLDKLRTLANNARGFIAGLETKERERTGMHETSGLSVPDDYQRRQTLAGGERYITPELKEYEDQVINASDRLNELETHVLDSAVPNDSELDADDAQIMLISGPNMAGKSTYIRQVAIIVLMAQMGSFVPARTADISLVDRIFTRVGLQDDLTTGQSTFMVEMVETASILNQATRRSLVILDEVGRGTSTYDGLSIAHAVVEHLHNNPRLGCKTLFATHYHELTELAATLPGVRNYNVAVTEDDGQIVFLRRIIPGGADRSYGVHVARLAGTGKSRTNQRSNGSSDLTASQQLQMPLFGSGDDELVQAVMEMDIANLTPLESINKLYELQEQASREELLNLSKEIGESGIAAMFATRSPSLKKMGLNANDLSDDRKLELMLEEPRLVRRPIVKVGDQLLVGANIKAITEALAI